MIQDLILTNACRILKHSVRTGAWRLQGAHIRWIALGGAFPEGAIEMQAHFRGAV
ncbi:hypothetical protein Z947_3476 [Sulfitobacter geojensis]|nr:hypothetical protein Z947_3476 [Sulfitobacter geojensis]